MSVIMETLVAFFDAEGHSLGRMFVSGPGYRYRKHYEKIDASGNDRGSPITDITIDEKAAEHAHRLLGVATILTRNGRMFVLDARLVSTLPGGYRTFHVTGIRVGLYNVVVDECFAIPTIDGSLVRSSSERGARTNLSDLLAEQADLLRRAKNATPGRAVSRGESFGRPELVYGDPVASRLREPAVGRHDEARQ